MRIVNVGKSETDDHILGYCSIIQLTSVMSEYEQPDEAGTVANCVMNEDHAEKDLKEKLQTAVEELKRRVFDHLKNRCGALWNDERRLALASAAYMISHQERHNYLETKERFDQYVKVG